MNANQLRSRSIWLGLLGLFLVVSGCKGSSSEDPAGGASSQAGAASELGGAKNATGGSSLSQASGGALALGEVSSGGTAGLANVGGAIAMAGATASGGAAGSSGLSFEPKPVRKLDLLLVVDNSLDMGPAQSILVKGAKELVTRLANPNCVALSNPQATERVENAEVACPVGFEREFTPVADLQVGVITSSLGGFGGTFCADTISQPRQNDSAHLIASIDPNISSYSGRGYWVWDPKGRQVPVGESNLTAFANTVGSGIEAVGSAGCGYEATLEAWYRFLVAPDPYQSLIKPDSFVTLDGTDSALLTQRSQFLRTDSHLAIVLLSTEDDCSAAEGGLSWLLASDKLTPNGASASFNMRTPTSTCDTDPNSACCRSCAQVEAAAPPGCVPVAQDPSCQGVPSLAAEKDPMNLRCFDQKRRFGLELLNPVERYVNALTQSQIPDRTGKLVNNPMFVAPGGVSPRNPAMVLVTSIVGVPWQAIATDPNGAQPQVTYLKPDQYAAEGIWGNILGDPRANVPPSDPLMRGSIAPRSGTSPRTNRTLAPKTSTDPHAAANGHEYDGGFQDDLQYACVFDLPSPVDCLLAPRESACECGAAPSGSTTLEDVQARVLAENRPVCNPPSGGPAQTTQYMAGARPAPRHLGFLKGLQSQARIGSVCPRYAKEGVARPTADPSFGYNPALSQVADWVGAQPK